MILKNGDSIDIEKSVDVNFCEIQLMLGWRYINHAGEFTLKSYIIL